MSDGHRTSSIVRPRPPGRSEARPNHASDSISDSVSDGTRFADFTRPISKERQLVGGHGKRLLIAATAAVLVTALLAAFFVLPVKSWFHQRDDIAERKRELAVLTAANAQLAADVTRLQTDDGIAEAARDEIGYVGSGEERVTVTPSAAPLTLPAGWPFDGVTQIVAIRSAAVAPTVAAPGAAPGADPAATTAVSAVSTPGTQTPAAG